MSNRFQALFVEEEPEAAPAKAAAPKAPKEEKPKPAARKPPVGSAEAAALKKKQQAEAEEKAKAAQFSAAGNDGASSQRGKPRQGGRGGASGARGGGRRGERAPKRDRHSNDGRHTSAKQEKQAWGGKDAQAELKVEEAAAADEKTEATEAKVEDAETPNVLPEEPPQLTLDEYLQQQAQSKLALESNERKTVEETNFDGYVPLEKRGAQPLVAGAPKKSEKKSKNQRAKHAVPDLFIGAVSTEPRREPRQPRSERPAPAPRSSGRGGARPARGRGPKPASAAKPTLNVADTKAFPAL